MRKKERNTYIVFGTLTIILYVVGIFTGFFLFTNSEANSNAKVRTLQSQIDGYKETLEWMRLEQLYLNSPREEIGCSFLTSSIERVHNDLSYFIKNLPEKLEVYEKNNPTSQDYENLKKDYMFVSIKAWMLSLSIREKCGSNIIPILYFYSNECQDCIEQGYVLDQIRSERNDVMVFTIDYNLPEDSVRIIKDSYDIEEVPSLLIVNASYQGFQDHGEMIKTINEIQYIPLNRI